MRAKTISAALALVAIAAVALPGGAGAAARIVKTPAATYENASLRGTNGFKIELANGPASTSVIATKRLGRGAFEVASYSTRDPKAFQDPVLNVRIGSYGRFHGHFVSRSTKREASGCKGGPSVVEKGFYVGSFVFRGADGFTRAAGRRIRGTLTHDPAEVCREPSAPKSSRQARPGTAKETRLNVTTKSDDVTFTAQQTIETVEGESLTETDFTASTYRRSGHLTISSLLFSFFNADTSAFVDPAPHTEATIAPAAPFSGSATYVSEGGKGGTWTGDLSVELPGFGRLPLTGKKFTATAEEGPAENSGSFYGGEVQTIR